MRLALGSLALVAIVAISLAPFVAPIEVGAKESHEEGGEQSAEHDAETVRGRMSLSEIETVTGAPAAYLIERLGLPEDVSLDSGVGKLGRENGFDVDAVRAAVDEYKEGMP